MEYQYGKEKDRTYSINHIFLRKRHLENKWRQHAAPAEGTPSENNKKIYVISVKIKVKFRGKVGTVKIESKKIRTTCKQSTKNVTKEESTEVAMGRAVQQVSRNFPFAF